MNTTWIQEAIVALAVAGAALYSLWRFVPGVRAALQRRFGARLASDSGCSDACGACSACGPKATPVHVVRGPVSTADRGHD